MALAVYKKKRNFGKTPEPEGKIKESKSKLIFVVQRHKASHLHYDFRLELDGVLKSWAIPKGPSMNPQDKRLAMMVEDHPYDYKDFEGIIPEGNYGAGIVEIWDSGTYSDLDNSSKKVAEKNLRAGIKSGSLKIRLFGKKLRGEFALVKIKGRDENTWLLLKHADDHAVHDEYNSEEHTLKNSPINKWLRDNRPERVPSVAKQKKTPAKKSKSKTAEKKITEAKKKVKKYLPAPTRKLPEFIAPMLAKETDAPFDNPEWLFEIKWDGYRAIAELKNGSVSLYSRNGNTFNESYPVIVNALAKMKINAVLDGEVVALDENGLPGFQLLQHYSGEYPLRYCVFDILFLDGKNLCDLSLTERKKILKKVLKKSDIINYSDHILETGIDFFVAAGEQNLEGIIAKKTNSQYLPGVRTSNWLKIKHHHSQEAIIVGYTEPGGSRKYFGSLILAVLDGKELKYIGHTGSGFNDKSLKEIGLKLQKLERKKSPLREIVSGKITWVKPILVAEIKFSEKTRDGKLRHPIFLGLRKDKKPTDVTPESSRIVKHPVGNKSKVKK